MPGYLAKGCLTVLSRDTTSFFSFTDQSLSMPSMAAAIHPDSKILIWSLAWIDVTLSKLEFLQNKTSSAYPFIINDDPKVVLVE
jgi:hypothetical protein